MGSFPVYPFPDEEAELVIDGPDDPEDVSFLRAGHWTPESSIASLLSASIHMRAKAASLRPMFHISREFFNIMQFLSVQVEPIETPTPGICNAPVDDPIHVSLELVSGAANAEAAALF